jgi:hypothetical protein
VSCCTGVVCGVCGDLLCVRCSVSGCRNPCCWAFVSGVLLWVVKMGVSSCWWYGQEAVQPEGVSFFTSAAPVRAAAATLWGPGAAHACRALLCVCGVSTGLYYLLLGRQMWRAAVGNAGGCE